MKQIKHPRNKMAVQMLTHPDQCVQIPEQTPKLTTMAEKYNMAEKPVAETAAMEDNVGPSKQLRACAPKKSDPTEQHLMSCFFPHPPLSFRQVDVAIAQ